MEVLESLGKVLDFFLSVKEWEPWLHDPWRSQISTR